MGQDRENVTHISEEQLVLYHYGETRETGEAAAVERHLAGCEICRAEYAALERVLAAASAWAVPHRGEDYGAEVWSRLSGRLPARRGFAGWLELLTPRRWAFAAAMAGLLIAAFLLGRFSPRSTSPTEPAVSAERVRERILLVSVSEHLDRSQMVLLELMNAGDRGAVDIAEEQQTAGDLVEASRLYRQTAAQLGDRRTVTVLDELERVLLDIARGPSEVSPAELEALRARIESQGILFKVRVVGSTLREQARDDAPAADLEQF